MCQCCCLIRWATSTIGTIKVSKKPKYFEAPQLWYYKWKNLFVIYGSIARKLYRVISASKRARKTMKQRCICLNFSFILLLNYLPLSIFFLESPKLQSLWLMPSEGQKTCFFRHFSKKIGG